MHHHAPRASSEVGRTKRTKRKSKAIIQSFENIEKPPVAAKKWLACKRGKPSSYWGIANELCSFISFMSFSNLANPIEWGLQSTYRRSQMTGLKLKKVWTSVCKPWTQSPQMWGTKALEMMLDDHWSSFENTLASNSTHCRVQKVIRLIRFSRLEHVAALWSTTVDYHHIPPPYSTIIPFAVWSCTRMQAESAYSEDHNLNSHGSHAPSCTTSFFRGGTNEEDQKEVQAHHWIN